MKKHRIIRVNHKILKFENNDRMLDRYTIFNNCLFRKKIKYLFIGLNPSASNDEFIDDTNTWIVNWILKKDKSDGYFLTNFFKDISKTAKKVIRFITIYCRIYYLNIKN